MMPIFKREDDGKTAVLIKGARRVGSEDFTEN